MLHRQVRQFSSYFITIFSPFAKNSNVLYVTNVYIYITIEHFTTAIKSTWTNKKELTLFALTCSDHWCTLFQIFSSTHISIWIPKLKSDIRMWYKLDIRFSSLNTTDMTIKEVLCAKRESQPSIHLNRTFQHTKKATISCSPVIQTNSAVKHQFLPRAESMYRSFLRLFVLLSS